MPRIAPSLPQLKKHKATGRAYCLVDGRFFYFGRYGTAAAREGYDRFIAEYLQRGRRVPTSDPAGVTVVEVIAAFWQHAKNEYRHPDGTPTSQRLIVKLAMGTLRSLYGRTPAADFGPMALKAVRAQFIQQGLSRRTCNLYTSVIRQAFRHAVAEEMVPPSVDQGLRAVPNLRRGKSGAKETELIPPVPEADIDAIKPYVSSQVWAMIQLQQLTGARPGEVLNLRPLDLDMSSTPWTCKLEQHKTAHHDMARVLYFGPQARDLIRPFLSNRAVTAPLFSPREGIAELKARGVKVRRRFAQKPNKRKTGRRVGDAYTIHSYRRAIERGCKLAGVEVWAPNRLRKNAATELRKQFGLDVAGVILGHAHGSAITAAHYARADAEKAMQFIERVG